MILAGDIGGTNTRLAIFEPGTPSGPIALEIYPSAAHGSLGEIVGEFLAEHACAPAAATFGIPGPVRGGRVEGVNLAWPVDADELARQLELPGVGLLNDLEANAWGIAALGPDDLRMLQEGDPHATGNRAVISAGTGLGMAGMYWDGEQHLPFATEGGHADFAPRTADERALAAFVAREHEHVSAERICSGMGLVNIFRWLLHAAGAAEPDWYRDAPDRAAAISDAGLDGADPLAERALDAMVAVYGAEAGNLALKVMATGGVYVGGGIAPKILPRLERGPFVEAFRAKGRLSPLMERIRVAVILNDRTALLGAGLHAARTARTSVRAS
jgi:glucokinase